MRQANSASEAWLNLLTSVLSEGSKISPRSQGCAEVLCLTSVVDMANPIVTVGTRKMSYRFMAAEAWWILSGKSDVESIAGYSGKIADFSDDGLRFDGAYGPKIAEQARFVVDKISGDPDTRQAVMSIWRPNPRDSKDTPCTLSLQFLMRSWKLDCVATMRSSDCWLGWVYDVFNFSCISAYVILSLRKKNSYFDKLELGRLFLTAGSQHIYDVTDQRLRRCSRTRVSSSMETPTLLRSRGPWSSCDGSGSTRIPR